MPAKLTLRAADVLFSQGFGTRRICAGLIESGALRVAGRVVDDPHEELTTTGLTFEVGGRAWPFQQHALVLLHKPAGYECSTKPRHWPSVLSLLPPPLRARGVQPVGRLDADTTGLLLLTDDGALIHRLSSPKRHVPKVYQAVTAEDLAPGQLQALLDGVVLNDDPKAVRAVAAHANGARELVLMLEEGKYHQVKRMVAAVGNAVVSLHRSRYGALALDAALPSGQWRFAAVAELGLV